MDFAQMDSTSPMCSDEVDDLRDLQLMMYHRPANPLVSGRPIQPLTPVNEWHTTHEGQQHNLERN